MINDRKIMISTGGNRRSTNWPASSMLWSELVARLQTPVRSTETQAEYLALSKARQDDLKDVGGFVAGTFTGQRRKLNAVAGRDVLTLDLDNIPPGATDDVLRRVGSLGCAYVVYSTRKHNPGAPRLRVLLPVDQTVTADEYEPIARKMAEYLDISLADPTTFDPSRLMYWPSVSSDGVYVYQHEDKPFLSAKGVLALYQDWHDVSEWPQVPGEAERHEKSAKIQKDPTTKPGIIGAFCRHYDIPRAIQTYLADRYDPDPQHANRYTYTGGSTTGGAITYDNDTFLYSYHATDPASGRLVNAFDLVRLHLYGDKDDEAKPETPANKLPSFVLMCQTALQDDPVAKLLHEERYKTAVDAFAETQGGAVPAEVNTDWMEQLQISGTTGAVAKTIRNVSTILQHDPALKAKVAFDDFSNRGLALGPLPWDKTDGRRDWKDPDDSGLREYLEAVYGITGKEKIYDGLTNVAMKNRFNEVRAYLDTLEWDGVLRIDTLLTDYFGAEGNAYTAAVCRKFLAAAVGRVYSPGIKFDYMPILAGPQGCGKSTFLARLGKRWYTDSLVTFEGKEAAEIIQGNWIVEVGELNAMGKSELNSVKQFLSRTDDVYREAYGRRTGRFPRRSVFAGTTNETEFLRDRTGNRRFWPVDLHPENATQDIFTHFDEYEIDQVWAEAKRAWLAEEPLYLPKELEALAREQQDAHLEANPKEGQILEFLANDLPQGWADWDLFARRTHWQNPDSWQGPTEPRERVCALELWCECFNGDPRFFDRREALEINSALSALDGWKRAKSSVRFGRVYGKQKAFEKVEL